MNRIGPDMPLTHWMLHSKALMQWLCRKRFRYFGEGAEFRPGAYAINCDKIWIGDRVVIRPGSMLFANIAGITIDDNVLLGAGVHIYVNNHCYWNRTKLIIDQGYCPEKGVWLRWGCWIGANSIILPGVTIGQTAVVGAGSVVTKSVPDHTVVAGNPAREINATR